MVEGHSVHRVAARHRQWLVGKRFEATSPNGRFTTGAAAIHNRIYTRVEAVGKNLFCFFHERQNDKKRKKQKSTAADDDDDDDDTAVVVVHVHFGMAGNWAIYMPGEEIPEPRETTRLGLVVSQEDGNDHDHQIVADLSAMTVQHGTVANLYHIKRNALGNDPLRDAADPDALWKKVSRTSRVVHWSLAHGSSILLYRSR
jgi:endonuclease VIII